jgi:hypothetical protein
MMMMISIDRSSEWNEMHAKKERKKTAVMVVVVSFWTACPL